MRTVRLGCLADLTDPASLRAVSVREEPLSTVGFSGATHRRLVAVFRSGETRHFVLKLCDPAREWTAIRSGDRVGREWSLLDAVWDAFVSPYVAYAVEGGRSGLLMDDLGAHVFPDVREPIARAHEDDLLAALARLHARFWHSPALSIGWLGRASSTSEIVLPNVLEDAAALALMPPALHERLRLGWDAALARLSVRAADVLRSPAQMLHEGWVDLPQTLVHGDVKVANFAPLPDGGVAAFDWALIGSGPSTTDLGWYLAVNASRLSRSKEAVIARYREFLERELLQKLDDTLWARLEDVAVIYGARTMLWAKGAQVAVGSEAAHAEWAWWARRLDEVAEHW
jgi:hypothetical protein